MRPERDKKRDGPIFIPPLYVDFFNRNGKNRHDEVISVPLSRGDSIIFSVGTQIFYFFA